MLSERVKSGHFRGLAFGRWPLLLAVPFFALLSAVGFAHDLEGSRRQCQDLWVLLAVVKQLVLVSSHHQDRRSPPSLVQIIPNLDDCACQVIRACSRCSWRWRRLLGRRCPISVSPDRLRRWPPWLLAARIRTCSPNTKRRQCAIIAQCWQCEARVSPFAVEGARRA